MPNMEILDNNSEMDILIEYDGEFGEFYEVPSAVKSVNGQTGDVVLDASDVGAIETESDPVFVNSPAYGISAEDIDSWDSKSDFSGDYNDLANKPTIPSQASDVHALPDDTTYVSSVDGKTGSVTVIPAGGSTGQVLAKASETDRDVEWTTPSGGGEVIDTSNVRLAYGTEPAGITSANIGDGLVDTGITLADLRKYKYFYIKIRLDDAKPYLGFRIGNTNIQVGSSNAIALQCTWLDNGKTVVMPVWGVFGNSSLGGGANSVSNNNNTVFSKLGDAIQHVGAIAIQDAPTSKVYVGVTHMNGLAETTKQLIWGVFGLGAYQ